MSEGGFYTQRGVLNHALWQDTEVLAGMYEEIRGFETEDLKLYGCSWAEKVLYNLSAPLLLLLLPFNESKYVRGETA